MCFAETGSGLKIINALTEASIQDAKPGKKPIRLFDGRGLYLEIDPSGGKWWRFKYRFGGKEKRLSLGVYPDVSLNNAREGRDDARKLLLCGVDPSEERKTMKKFAQETGVCGMKINKQRECEFAFLLGQLMGLLSSTDIRDYLIENKISAIELNDIQLKLKTIANKTFYDSSSQIS